jgi:hypothetical protein
MKTRHLLFLLAWLASASSPAHAFGEELIRVEHCHTSRTPQARAECEQRRQDLERAYRRERQQKRLDDARAAKNSTLCFTRKATQEVVCPN